MHKDDTCRQRCNACNSPNSESAETETHAGEDEASISARSHLSENDLARRWRVSRRTLQRWRGAGKTPPHLQIGQRILYRREDVLAFETSRLRRANGDPRSTGGGGDAS